MGFLDEVREEVEGRKAPKPRPFVSSGGFLDEVRAEIEGQSATSATSAAGGFLDEVRAEIEGPRPKRSTSTTGSFLDEVRAELSAPRRETEAQSPEAAGVQQDSPGVSELLSLDDYLLKAMVRRGRKVRESPWRAFLPFDAAQTLAEELAGVYARITKNPELFERVTGEKFLTEKELARLPPEERRKAERRQQTIVENLWDELVELGRAIPRVAIGAAEGIAKIPERYEEARAKGADVGEAVWASTTGIRDTGAGVLAGIGKGLIDLVVDPVQSFHDAPLETLGTVSGVGKVGIRALKGAQAAAAFERALTPSHWILEGTKRLVKKNPSLTTAAQFLVSRKIGVAEPIWDALDDYERSVAAKAARRLDELEGSELFESQAERATKSSKRIDEPEEPGLADAKLAGDEDSAAKRVDDDVGAAKLEEEPEDPGPAKLRGEEAAAKASQRLGELEKSDLFKLRGSQAVTVYKALSADKVQRKIGNLTEAQRNLLRDLRELGQKGVFKGNAELLDKALDDPVLLDALRKEKLGRTDDLAQAITEAQAISDVVFVVDGKPLNTIRFLYSGEAVDPSKIEIKVLTDNPVLKAKAGQILRARQLLMEISNEALELGLISPETYRIHAPRYVRDIYRGFNSVEREALDNYNSVVKNRAPDATPKADVGTRKALGADFRHMSEYISAVRSALSNEDLDVDFGPYQEAKIKHGAAIEERVALGAMSPEELSQNLAKTLVDATVTHEWLRFLDFISDPAKHGLHGEKFAFTADDLEKLGATFKRKKDVAVLRENRRTSDSYKDSVSTSQKSDSEAVNTASGTNFDATSDAHFGAPSGVRRLKKVPENEESFGPLSGKYVDEPTWNLVVRGREAKNEALKALREFTNNWKYGRVVGNLPSHVNQLFGNVFHHVVDSGGNVSEVGLQFARAARSLRKKDEVYKAARDAGLLRESTYLDEAGGRLLLDRLSRAKNPFRWIREELRSRGVDSTEGIGSRALATGLAIHKYVNVGNPISQALGKLWQASDDVSRLSFFRRQVERLAKERGIPFTKALRDEEIVRAAKKHVEDYHPNYRDAPLALEILDKYGVMPFVRYSSNIFGLYTKLNVTHPWTIQALRQGGRHYYENADRETQERLELGPLWSIGRNVPIDAIARKFGVEEPIDLNARYLSPVPTPTEALGLQRGGSFGADIYDPRLKLIPKGPAISVPLEFAIGRSLEFEKELSDEERVKNLFFNLTPGFLGYNLEKITSALRGRKDFRGRELSLARALLHYAGFKVEEANPARIRALISKGAREARREAADRLRYELTRAATEEERREAYERHKKRLREIDELQAALLSGER